MKFVVAIILIIIIAYTIETVTHSAISFRWKKYSYNGVRVTWKQYQEAKLLEKKVLFANKYYKVQVVTLFLSVKKRFPLRIKGNERHVLILCESEVLRILNYSNWTLDEAASMRALNDIDLYYAVKKQSHKVVKKITGNESEDFYIVNADAWEVRYGCLENEFAPAHVEQFYKDVCRLAELNKNRITVERKIYLKSYQFLVNTDREYALRFFLWSLPPVKNQKISARNRKILFRNKSEEQAYDAICSRVLSREYRTRALEQFDQLNITQRKKINLDVQTIKTVAKKQSKVAGVLGELLAEEEEQPVIVKQLPVEEKTVAALNSDDNHKEALFQLFIVHSFQVNKEEVDIFARSRGIFTGQFIERLNEEYYEELDDILIEEDNNYYLMNEDYYQQIKENGN